MSNSFAISSLSCYGDLARLRSLAAALALDKSETVFAKDEKSEHEKESRIYCVASIFQLLKFTTFKISPVVIPHDF